MPPKSQMWVYPSLDRRRQVIDGGVAQLRQGGGGGLATGPAVAVDQHSLVLVWDDLCGAGGADGGEWQQFGSGDVAGVVLVLFPNIQNQQLLSGVHHFLSFLRGDGGEAGIRSGRRCSTGSDAGAEGE